MLRRLGQIDAGLATLLSRPVAETPPAARALLRLGLTQILFLGTPPHAVVDTAVTLAHRRRPQAPPSLINAVLRRAASAGGRLIEGHDAPRLNTPDWLWQALTEAYGAVTSLDTTQSQRKSPGGAGVRWLPARSRARQAGAPAVSLCGATVAAQLIYFTSCA